MARVLEKPVALARRGALRWTEAPPKIRRVFRFVAVAGLLPWLTMTSYDVANYALGADQLLSGQSVYAPRAQRFTDGRLVPSYPYLPSFAMVLALGIAPFYLLSQAGVVPTVLYEAIARQIANAPGYLALLGVPALAYLVNTDASRGATARSTSGPFWSVLVVALTPALWFQVLESGSDTFVALLALAGVYAVMRDAWLLAGLLVGAATFKFTGLPFAVVLALYALGHGRDQFVAVALGGLASQLPNVLYFAVRFEDFLFVLQRRGTMSLYSGQTSALATAPFRVLGLEQWYIDVGFAFAFLAFVALGALVAFRRENLVLGFAVAYFATSYFAPVGEINPSVLVVFLLFEAATNFHRQRVRYLAGLFLAVELFSFFSLLRHIDYVSTIPFPWWSTALQAIEFGTVCAVLFGLIWLSDHGTFQSPAS